eukprot:Tamp_19489.p1 GENE.Tamp_19489~~Tamp_19489.p1  ORF type:complete len:374 (+),score=94.55 Tamp_19489:25-1146(+)
MAAAEAAAAARRPLREAPFFRDFVRDVPKVELHQHLTGSLDNASLRAALARRGLGEDLVGAICPLSAEHQDDAWGHLTRYCVACARAVEATAPGGGGEGATAPFFAEAFALLRAAGVIYCEIRVGLKDEPTKRAYLERLLSVVDQENASGRGLRVGVLVSVARHGDLDYGRENAEVAIALRSEGRSAVCGVELGGVPSKRSFPEDWQPVFERARHAGMKIALHCGEDASKQEEWRRMIEFGPDRLGHCVLLDEANMERLLASQIPVEACLTCHEKHFGIPVPDNIFGRLRAQSAPVVLGTDNPSIYGITLADEYAKACEVFGLSARELVLQARSAIAMTFLDQAGRAELEGVFDAKVDHLAAKYGLRPEDLLR